MLSNLLAEALVTRGVIGRNTQVELEVEVYGISGPKIQRGVFHVMRMDKDKLTGNVTFRAMNVEDSSDIIDVAPNTIMCIDGMDPRNVAKAYGLNLDGTIHREGKKRGRPRTHPLPVPINSDERRLTNG